MKKFLILAALILVCAAFVGAQQFSEEKTSEFYVKSVPIIKVYPHNLGYRVIYMRSSLELADFYVPLEWFYGAAGKGELVFGRQSEYPFFSIYWKGTEFDHIRMYLQKDLNHPSWGHMSAAVSNAARANFDVETLELEF